MLKKELLELCLLQLLAEGDQYGYELIRRLRGLCREGCTETYQGQTSGGPARKYYRITQSGRERHSDLLNQWRELRRTLETLGVE